MSGRVAVASSIVSVSRGRGRRDGRAAMKGNGRCDGSRQGRNPPPLPEYPRSWRGLVWRRQVGPCAQLNARVFLKNPLSRERPRISAASPSVASTTRGLGVMAAVGEVTRCIWSGVVRPVISPGTDRARRDSGGNKIAVGKGGRDPPDFSRLEPGHRCVPAIMGEVRPAVRVDPQVPGGKEPGPPNGAGTGLPPVPAVGLRCSGRPAVVVR